MYRNENDVNVKKTLKHLVRYDSMGELGACVLAYCRLDLE